jgi:hypothetical protein
LKQEEIQRFGATTIVARQAFRPAISDIWRSQARSGLARRADALISNETAGYTAVMVAVPQAKFFEGVAEAHCFHNQSLLETPVWNEAAILKWGEDLFNRALKLWERWPIGFSRHTHCCPGACMSIGAKLTPD